jgi:hypothetical protein
MPYALCPMPYFLATAKMTKTLLIAEILAFVPAAIGLLPSPIYPSTYRFSAALQTHPLAKPD